MTFRPEYHSAVGHSSSRLIPALPALFGVLLLSPFLVPYSFAQFNGATSAGSSHSISVAPPTRAIAPPTGSIAPRTGSVAPPTAASFPQRAAGHFPNNSPHAGEHRHHGRNSAAYYPYFYGVPVPYVAADSAEPDSSYDENDPDYQGGPTIFDRRGSGAASYIPPDYQGPAHASSSRPGEDQSDSEHASDSLDTSRAAESRPTPTALVFKDGHELEVENYAIIGQTLYDLTPGHPRKIATSDLDLAATQKHNEDRGVTFQLPPSAPGN